MDIVQEKNKRTGLIVTIVVHAVLLLLFALYGLTYLDPPPEPEGISINFGNTNMGRMTESNAPPQEKQEVLPSESQEQETTPTENTEEEVLTQESEEAPVMEKKEEKKEVVEKVEEPVEEVKKPDQRTTDALNKWKNNQTEASGGDGTTDQSGDQGSVDGDKNSSNYSGGGQGNGTTFSLAGRSLVSSPNIEDKSQEEGKVVVDIIVDRYGKVIRASPGARGSTTTSALLYEKAKQAALLTKFNANPDAAEEQKGQMTFIFILN